MMWRLWLLAGRVAYWMSWPILYFYLRGSRRTRVLVMHGDEVLVVRGWLGNGRWLLPGGGLKKNEAPAEGAIRELQEETGIEVTASELQLLVADELIRQNGLPFKLYGFAFTLDAKPKLHRQAFEISHITWMNRRELLENQAGDTDIRRLVEAFYKK